METRIQSVPRLAGERIAQEETDGGDPPGEAVDRAVLLTVLYADLFDCALTRTELRDRLVGCSAAADEVQAAVDRLTGHHLQATGEYVVWTGREHLIDVRRRRKEAARSLWRTAERYGRWLAHVPFLRMVAISGSLAVDNAEQTSDVDLFCITEADRLWLARLFIVPLSKATRLLAGYFPAYLCPNYILAMNALEVEHRNLFTASEVKQAVPLWGATTYRLFRNANGWVSDFLPCRSSDMVLPRAPRKRTLFARALERMLAGRTGDAANVAAHRLFVWFYRRRAVRRNWDWSALEPAYQVSRYTVPEGGYVRAVRRLFSGLVRRRTGALFSPDEIDALFPAIGQAPTFHDWDRLFMAEYGGDSPEEPMSVSCC